MGILSDLKKQQKGQKNTNPERLPTQAQLMLRILVGGYLYYLIYQLLTGGALQNTGWKLAVMIGGIVLFAVFGGYFIVMSVRMLMRQEYYDPNSPQAEEIVSVSRDSGSDCQNESDESVDDEKNNT